MIVAASIIKRNRIDTGSSCMYVCTYSRDVAQRVAGCVSSFPSLQVTAGRSEPFCVGEG